MRLSMDTQNIVEAAMAVQKEPPLMLSGRRGSKKQLFTLAGQDSASSLDGKFGYDEQVGTLNQQ